MWQPIDTAPKDGTPILVRDGECVTTVEWNKTREYWGLCVPGSYCDDDEYLPYEWRHIPND